MLRNWILEYANNYDLQIIEWPANFRKTSSRNANFKFKCLRCGKVFVRGGYFLERHCYSPLEPSTTSII